MNSLRHSSVGFHARSQSHTDERATQAADIWMSGSVYTRRVNSMNWAAEDKAGEIRWDAGREIFMWFCFDTIHSFLMSYVSFSQGCQACEGKAAKQQLKTRPVPELNMPIKTMSLLKSDSIGRIAKWTIVFIKYTLWEMCPPCVFYKYYRPSTCCKNISKTALSLIGCKRPHVIYSILSELKI